MFGSEQMCPQLPQFVTLVWRFTSHPSWLLPLQSAVPAAHCTQTLGEPAQTIPRLDGAGRVQPSPFALLWSSQASPPVTMPFPQMAVQTLGEPTHTYPGSTVQVAEQPSPFALLASSHPSKPLTIPLPQIAVQMLGEPTHTYPGSTAHVWLHPSPGTVLQSSHPSPPLTTQFPQTAVHTLPMHRPLQHWLSMTQAPPVAAQGWQVPP